MKKLTRLLLGVAATAAFGSAAFALEQSNWSYGGNTGPGEWASMDARNQLCSTGRLQSPINLLTGKAQRVAASDLKLNYHDSKVSAVNNGHTIEVGFKGGENGVEFNGNQFTLAQFHFHTPSEHSIDGKHFPMEIHLVNKAADGSIAVIGVFIREGRENKPLEALFEHLPLKGADALALELDPASLLPADRTGLTYTGSLTTPPCTENVHWLVLEHPVEMSARQIHEFQKQFRDNHRPVQPFNDRKEVEEKTAF